MSKLPDFEGPAMFAKVAEERSFAGAESDRRFGRDRLASDRPARGSAWQGRLINRTSRRLALTDYGHTLAERASEILRRGGRGGGLRP